MRVLWLAVAALAVAACGNEADPVAEPDPVADPDPEPKMARSKPRCTPRADVEKLAAKVEAAQDAVAKNDSAAARQQLAKAVKAYDAAQCPPAGDWPERRGPRLSDDCLDNPLGCR